MIRYRQGGVRHILNLFLMSGSVFPFSSMVSIPSAVAAFIIKWLVDRHGLEDSGFDLLNDNAPWSSFTTVVSFLIVFRTSQSYARFWDGATATHGMRADWLEACRTCVAFTAYSEASPQLLQDFQWMAVRLFSMLHALALAEMEDCISDDPKDFQGFNLELFDAESLDEQSLRAIKNSNTKVELLMQWILRLLIEHMGTGVLSIPPPVLSRVFHELEEGYIKFHKAVVISAIPFPFPYAQACDCLLIIHAIALPVFIVAHVRHASMAALLAFSQVFALQMLNNIAIEIENPFGADANDLDLGTMQTIFTSQLRNLIQEPAGRLPSCTQPEEVGTMSSDGEMLRNSGYSGEKRMTGDSFYNIWTSPSRRTSSEKPNTPPSEEDPSPTGEEQQMQNKESRASRRASHTPLVAGRTGPAFPADRAPRASTGELSMSTVSFTMRRGGSRSSMGAVSRGGEERTMEMVFSPR